MVPVTVQQRLKAILEKDILMTVKARIKYVTSKSKM